MVQNEKMVYIKRSFKKEVIFYDTSTKKIHYTKPENATRKNTLTLTTFVSDAPLRVYFDPTYRCNLRCRHCITSSSPDAKDPEELGLRRTKQLFKELAAIGVLELSITGGEPFVHPRIIELIKCAQDNGLNLTIASNGTLITSEKAGKLADLGVNDIRISIDGYEHINDGIRGAGTYKKAIEGVKNLVHAGVPVSVRMTLTKNIDEGLELMFKDLKNTGVENLKAAIIKEAGKAKLEENADLFGYQANKETMQHLLELGKKNDITVELSSDDFDFDLTITADKKLRRNENKTCGAGSETAYISPKGEVLMCSTIPHVILGSIRNSGFSEVWNGKIAKNYRSQALAAGIKKVCSINFVNVLPKQDISPESIPNEPIAL